MTFSYSYSSSSSSSSSSSIGSTARRLTLSIFSFPALEDLFLLLLPSFPGFSPSSYPLQFLSEDLFRHPILLLSLQVT